jgi:hypothetical protein
MKLYATVSSERASKGQGGNKHTRIEVNYGGKTHSSRALTILADVLPPSANRVGIPCAVFQVWGKRGELCERQVFPLIGIKH